MNIAYEIISIPPLVIYISSNYFILTGDCQILLVNRVFRWQIELLELSIFDVYWAEWSSNSYIQSWFLACYVSS